MSEETESVKVWLVERTVTEKPSLINHVYATTDGEQYVLEERSVSRRGESDDTTAAIEVDADDLTAVEDETRKEEYAAEASRMADSHAPDDPI